MLQKNLSRSERSQLAPFAGLAREDGIAGIFVLAQGLIRRQYGTILACAAAILALSAIYLLVTPPVYTARVQVLFGNPKAQFIQQQSLVAEPLLDFTQFETQMQLLKSRSIATSVIDQLNLTADLRPAPRSGLTGVVRRVRSWIGGSAPDNETHRLEQHNDEIVTAFLDNLSATRVGMSNFIEISFNWSNPLRAAEIANAVANAYISDQLNAKFEANKSATAWLQKRLHDLGEQADAAERVVNTYKSVNNIVSAGGKLLDEQQVTEINSRLVAARAQTGEALARVDRYESVLKENPEFSRSIGTLDSAGSDVLANPIITGLRQQYLELTRRENEWSGRFGKEHSSVVNLQSRMREIRGSILDEVRRLSETSKSDLEVSRRRQQELEKQLEAAVSSARTTNSAEVNLRDLETKAKGYRSLYDNLLQRYMGSAQHESFPISEARIVNPAIPPQSKSKPKTLAILAISLVGGICLGGALGFVRETMDRVFRTPDQVENALGLSCISIVPLLPASRASKETSASDHSDLGAHDSGSRGTSHLHRTVVNEPLSRFAESMRSIKMGIDLNPEEASNKVIGITSSLPSEGKTTIAASLAQVIAQGGKSVLLVDCDFRNPSLSAALAPDATIGLLDVVLRKHSIEDTLLKDPKSGTIFLPAGKRRPLLSSSEILATEQMRRLFEKLRSKYDYVIVDLPPLTPVVDVRATTSLTDCYVLVVEWGKTKIDVVQHALRSAPNVYESLLGVVLNKTDIRSMASYDAYVSDYYKDSHYTHYHFTGNG
jgi:polysaccharide biosynthesis transport protein